MTFPYSEYEVGMGKVISRPTVPITFLHEKIALPVDDALVDTGADKTLLPIAFANVFGMTFDLEKDGEIWHGAGGGTFRVFASPVPVECMIEQKGHQPVRWKTTVYFTLEQPTILLGYKGFHERFNLTFRGKKKELELHPA